MSKRWKEPELPDLVKPSGKGVSWPVEGSAIEIWEADFMERDNMPSLDRSQWPAQNERDLIIEFPVRKGECPNDEDVLWVHAKAHLKQPFRGNLRRIR